MIQVTKMNRDEACCRMGQDMEEIPQRNPRQARNGPSQYFLILVVADHEASGMPGAPRARSVVERPS